MKKTLISHNIKNVQRFSDFIKKQLPDVKISDCGYFDI